jgi:hypothetical protein
MFDNGSCNTGHDRSRQVPRIRNHNRTLRRSGSNAKGEDRSIAEAMPEHEPAIHEPMPEREPVSEAVPKHESMSAHHGHLLNIGSGRSVKKGKRAA